MIEWMNELVKVIESGWIQLSLDETATCESGACSKLFLLVYFDLALTGSCPPSVGYPIIRLQLKPLAKDSGRFSIRRHYPQTTTLTSHFLGGRNPYLVLFWQKCLITEWFSWLIIKTALDRSRRVAFTNTCVFYRRLTSPEHTPTHSNHNKIEHY
jgi:hypothetical protein